MLIRIIVLAVISFSVGCANQIADKPVEFNSTAIQKNNNSLGVESEKSYRTPKEMEFENAKKLAIQGDVSAQINLAVMYDTGDGVPKDLEKAAYWLTKAAEQGNPEAQYAIGVYYFYGDGVPKDSKQAIYWLRKASEQKYIAAQEKLGLIYYEGKDVPQDLEKATYYFTKAAEQGDAVAQYLVGVSYYMGSIVPKDIDKGKYWITRAAAQGYEKANNFLFHKKTLEKAEQGDPKAQNDLGLLLYNGQMDVKKDIKQAVYWIEKAAEQGYPQAQYNMGSFYYEGDVVTQDYDHALEWFSKSAEQGYPDAQLALGRLYFQGHIIPEDNKKAIYWISKAAMQGHASSQYYLGLAYFTGKGVPENDKHAYAWFNLSASHGYDEAIERRDFMTNNVLSRHQLSEAQDLTIILMQEIEQYNDSNNSEASKTNTDTNIISSGTGFLITVEGYVITCYHVVKNKMDIRVVFNARMFPAEVVLTDPKNDLALLKIEGFFPAMAFSTKRSAKIGEKVFTVGYPNPNIQGVNLKYNSGTISSLTGFQDDVRLYQISVPVQPGNSGGPLVDENGHILGVVVSQLDAKTAFAATGSLPQNVNYAIKSIYIQAMLDTLPEISDKLIIPTKSNSDLIEDAKESTVMILCYSR